MLIPEEKFRRIASRLLTKTQSSEVLWKHDDSDDWVFVLDLPKSRVRLSLESPRAEPDRIVMSIMEDADLSVADWKVEEGDPDWGLVRALYDSVSRAVLGWDKVLADVEEAVEKEGPIGLPD
jgi:hypothetical protein